MPKWTDYTIKTTVADNDEVMTLDTAGKANKRLLLSTLSDWVLGKIADKVFEKLQTNDKTILGAINELNSNRLKYITKTYDSIHIQGGGYTEWRTIADGLPNVGNIYFTEIINWSTNSSYKPFVTTPNYIMGEPNSTITNLKVRFFYV